MKNTRSRASSQKPQNPGEREELNQKPRTFIIKKSPVVSNKAEQSTNQSEAKRTHPNAPTVILKASDKVAIIKNSKILIENPEKNIQTTKPPQKVDMNIQTEDDPTEEAYKKLKNEIEYLNSQQYNSQKENKLLNDRVAYVDKKIQDANKQNIDLKRENEQIRQELDRERQRSNSLRIQSRNTSNDNDDRDAPIEARILRTFQTLNYLQMIGSLLGPGNGQQNNTQQQAGLMPDKIRKLPKQYYKRGTNNQDQCAICLADYENGDKLRKLPCNHLFHSKCAKDWLFRKNQCPMCKKEDPEKQADNFTINLEG